MKEKEKPSERERRDWVIILIILLFGFLCVILAGERAVRFSPNWKLNTNMMSNLDPDSDFLTDKPVNLYEPLDPAILTQPAWASLFLTPGAVFETGTPLPPPTNTPLGTNTPLPTLYLSPTALLPSPTNTLVYFPPPLPTSTPKKPPPPTATTPPTLIPTVPPPTVDLQVTKTDGVVVYKANDILNYTIVVTNNGPSGVTNATVQDTLTSTNINSATWTCTAGVGASCTPSGAGVINDTAVTIPAGTSVTYSVIVNIVANPLTDLTNTVTVTEPGGVVESVPGNNSASDTDTLAVNFSSTDLETTSPPTGAPYQYLANGQVLTLTLPTSIFVGSHPSWDLYYYEQPNGAGIAMDWITLEIGDSTAWYPVLVWGDCASDFNTNISHAILGIAPTTCTSEPDNYAIPSGFLINSTGVAIDVDGLGIPAGEYPYLRIRATVGSGSGDSGLQIDGIYVVP